MAEKNFNNVRIINKHDTEENWLKATGFIPKQGELIVYDKDSTHGYERFKIGDGSTVVSSLPFADANKVDKVAGKGLSTNDYTTAEKNKLAGIAEGANKTVVDDVLSASSTNPVQNKVVNTAINDLSDLIGGTKVSEQIEAAQIVYVGPTRPTDSNIKVWINTSEEGTGVVPIIPIVSSVALPASGWTGHNPYSQTVDVPSASSTSMITLQPSAQQILDLQNEEITMTVENDGNGNITFYCINGVPSFNMNMQILISAVAYA